MTSSKAPLTLSVTGDRRANRLSSALFAVSVLATVTASLFAGAMARPLVDRWRGPSVADPGDVALFLEHTAVDVRLGRAGALVEPLRSLAGKVKDRDTRERVLALLTEAALQAGRLADAASAEAEREPLVAGREGQDAARLRRIALATALEQREVAEALAKPLIAGQNARLADQARLRLAAAMAEPELRAWIATTSPRDVEDARRAGLAALRLLGDAAAAEALLRRVEGAGQRDASLLEAQLDAATALKDHGGVARAAEGLLALTTAGDVVRERIALVRAVALGRAGAIAEATLAFGLLQRSPDPAVRWASRQARYEMLRDAGRLSAEVAAMRDPQERAFVALEVERDYVHAVQLYEAALRGRPDSVEAASGLREATRRRDLAERRALYEQVLRREPTDEATRAKLLATLTALGEGELARRQIAESLRGRERAPGALVAAASASRSAGLDRDAVAYLEKAYAGEVDPARKQQILFALGDVLAGARQEPDARRVLAGLATTGVSTEIREQAVSRLARLLH